MPDRRSRSRERRTRTTQSSAPLRSHPRSDRGRTERERPRRAASREMAPPSRNRGGRTPERARGGRTPERARGGRTPERARGGRTPERTRGGRSPERTRGGRSPERTRGGSREEYKPYTASGETRRRSPEREDRTRFERTARAPERPSTREVSAPKDTTRVFIGNLSSKAGRSDLQRFFEKTALSGTCRLSMKDGYAVAEFSSKKDAEKAVQTNGSTYLGRELHVSYTYEGLWKAHKDEDVEDQVEQLADEENELEEDDRADHGCSELEQEDEEGYDEPDEFENDLPGEGANEEEAHGKHEGVEHRHGRSMSRGRAPRGRGAEQGQGNDGHLKDKVARLEQLLRDRDCEIRRLKTSLARFQDEPDRNEPDRRSRRREITKASSRERPREERVARDAKRSAVRSRSRRREGTRGRTKHSASRGRGVYDRRCVDARAR